MTRTSTRILDNIFFVTLFMALLAVAVGGFLYNNRLEKHKRYAAQQQAMLNTAYDASIRMHGLAMDGFFANTICQPRYLQLLAQGVHSAGTQRELYRGRLLRQLYPVYQAMKKHNLLQLHFHLSDGTSFLRFHQPDRYGDPLFDVRPSVRIANTERRPVHGFEIGKFRSGFRYVYPLSWEGQYLGSVEVSVTAKAIRDAMAEFDPHREYAFLLDRHFTEPNLFPEQRQLFSSAEIHPDFIIEDANAVLPESPPPLSADAHLVSRRLRNNRSVQDAMSKGEPITVGASTGESAYVTSLIPIKDVTGRVAGYLTTFAQDRMFEIYRNEFMIYITAAVFTLGLIAMLLIGLQKRTLALGREQHNLKVMTDTLAEGVYVMDAQGAILRVNPAACKMLGYAEEELVGRNAHAIFHSHGQNGPIAIEDCLFFKQISQGLAYDGEEYFKHKNGSIMMIELASRPIMDNHQMIGSVTAFHDITERKRTEEALKKSEHQARKLSTAVEQSPASVLITDATGRIEYINPKFEEVTGYSSQEAIGRTPRILKSGQMPAETYEDLWKTIRSGSAWKGELHNRRKSGALFWEYASISPIRNDQGEITHFISIKEDITERKRMENELRENEFIQRTLMERLPVGLVIIDPHTRVIEMANPTAITMFGAAAKVIIGERCHQFMCPADENSCPILDKGQIVDNSDRLLIRHDHSRLPVLKTVNRITIKGREKLLECIIDISSRVAAEKALKNANEELKEAILRANSLAEKAEAANRAKSVFLAHMSHEIRTPLNVILGYAQLLQMDSALQAEQLKQVQTINRSGDHLLELINSILEMSKIEAGHVQTHNEPMDFDHLLHDVIGIFQLSCRKKQIALELKTVDRLPGRIVADRGKVRQILINLVSNAVKFTDRGGVTMRVAGTRSDPMQWLLSVDVIDTGPGIAPAEQDKVFEAFEQTTAGQHAPQGTGLGLPISRAYARAMGGDLLLFASDSGKGATFRFTFSAIESVVEGTTPGKGNTEQPVVSPPLARKNLKALIVEDDLESSDLLHTILAEAGMTVSSAHSGEEGLQKFAGFKPDIVLLDVNLPGIDGFETARRIRQLPAGRTVKIISVTASGITLNEIRNRAEHSGIDELIPKPFKIADVLLKLDQLCGLFKTEEDCADPSALNAYDPSFGAMTGNLPANLTTGLITAVELGDMNAFERLSDEVVSIDALLASHLKELAQRFEYAALLDMLTPPSIPNA